MVQDQQIDRYVQVITMEIATVNGLAAALEAVAPLPKAYKHGKDSFHTAEDDKSLTSSNPQTGKNHFGGDGNIGDCKDTIHAFEAAHARKAPFMGTWPRACMASRSSARRSARCSARRSARCMIVWQR